MAIKKIRIRPPGYEDILHPETSADVIVETTDKKVLTAEERTKIAGVETGANKTIVVDNLTSTSQEAALSAQQGKVLKDNLENKADKTEVESLLSEKANITDIPDNLTTDTLQLGDFILVYNGSTQSLDIEVL